MTTKCVAAELEMLGEDFRGAKLLARRMEIRKCPHRDAVTVIDCFKGKSIIGKDNHHKLCIATQDPALKKWLNESVPGVPIISIHSSVLVRCSGLNMVLRSRMLSDPTPAGFKRTCVRPIACLSGVPTLTGCRRKSRRNTVKVIDKVSEATKEALASQQRQTMEVPANEAKYLAKVAPKDDPSALIPQKKRKRKEANPLSQKKKKKAPQEGGGGA
jgi:hypothetical protein